MRARALLLGAALLAAGAAPARAQGSVFALRGLGFLGRPVSGRAAGSAGSQALFDPQMTLNPAALARWRSVAAWAVAVPSRQKFDGPSGKATLTATRFPLFGIAAVLPERATVGFSISEYLDRTWTLTQTDSVNLRGTTETFTDAGRSIGGISDMQLGIGYQLHPDIAVGLGLHYYLGSARLTSQRVFDNTAYASVLETSVTDFRGVGVGAGVAVTRGRIDLGFSGRVNGRLRSHNSDGQTVHTSLPREFAAGLRYQPVPGVFVAGTARYDGWARASGSLNAGDEAHNVWAFSVGAEVLRTRVVAINTPLRVGYRWRELPFSLNGETLKERAFSAGFGLNLAQGRTTVDVGFERGRRTSGAAREDLSALFVGVTVRP